MEFTDKSQITIRQEALGFLDKHKPRWFGLRMTPMIDVIFLLLAFFVLTAKFRMPEQFLPVMLPTVSAQELKAGLTEPLEIYMSVADDEVGCLVRFGSGNMFKSVTIEEKALDDGLVIFSNELISILNSQKRMESDPIEIQCANEVKWDYFVKISNVLYGMGANNITFSINE